ncbi:putative mitochondrial protein [Tanacetum coccineum]
MGETMAWNMYEEATVKRFGFVNEDPMAELKNLSQKEFVEKRAKNQFFYYDKKYVPGHKCDGQLFEETPQSLPHISLNTLSGVPTHNTMRLKGHVLKQILHILIDSGSTYNFLNIYMAKRVGSKIRTTCPLQVSVAGGSKLWLSTLGTIQLNFKDLTMQFYYEGPKVVLRETHQFELAWLIGKQMSKLVSQTGKDQISSMCCFGQSATLNLMQCDNDQSSLMNAESHQLLEEYPPNQKDTIEAIIKELLDSWVIRPSNSPFSSLIFMVKKKDSSWRMCIDYRQLNKHIVKDKLLIPAIKELIDELQGAHVFSKLDLRSGYHQIIMCKEDVYKTAFKSHEGHYEFVVISFGLTNAPSTFQAFINSVFKPFLRKFTLLFFDDILVYSPSIAGHINHLRMVLQVMRNNTLFAKKSKCAFRTTQVEYLGNIISTQGVSINPSKVKAMQECVPITLKQFMGLTGYYRRFIKGYMLLSVSHSLDNAAVDDLSRIERQGVLFSLLVRTSNELMDAVNDQLRMKDKWVVGQDLKLRKKLIHHFQSFAVGGHSEVHATSKRLTTYFYWKGLRNVSLKICRLIRNYISLH